MEIVGVVAIMVERLIMIEYIYLYRHKVHDVFISSFIFLLYIVDPDLTDGPFFGLTGRIYITFDITVNRDDQCIVIGIVGPGGHEALIYFLPWRLKAGVTRQVKETQIGTRTVLSSSGNCST